jgi:uncharacterized membrane protein YbhN (UPF0104 family)
MFIIFAILAYYVKSKGQEFNILRNISLSNIILLVLASILFRVALGYNFYLLMLFFDIKMMFKEWLGLTTISTMTNYLLPAKGGIAAQAVYLKNTYGFAYTQFLSSTIGLFVITFLMNAIIGLSASITALYLGVMTSDKIMLFFIVVTAITAASYMLMLAAPKIKIKNPYFKNMVNGFEKFRYKPLLFTKFLVSQAFIIIAIGLRLFFAFRSVGIDINIIGCVVITLFTSFFMFLSLTPANLGIKEFFITLSSTAFGLTPAQGLAAALVDRGFDVIISFIGGGIFSIALSNMKWWKKPAVNGENT